MTVPGPLETELVLALPPEAKVQLRRVSERKLGWFLAGRWTTTEPEKYDAFLPADTLSLLQMACAELGSKYGCSGAYADVQFKPSSVLINIKFVEGDRYRFIYGEGSDAVVACLRILKKAYDWTPYTVESEEVLGRAKSKDTLKG